MQTGAAFKMIALTVMVILFTLNYLGIKMSSRAQNILSGLKIAMILLFCSGCIWYKNPNCGDCPVSKIGDLVLPVFLKRWDLH